MVSRVSWRSGVPTTSFKDVTDFLCFEDTYVCGQYADALISYTPALSDALRITASTRLYGVSGPNDDV